uniref:EF-hand domain-containing protein n=1 Tax=Cryptomonas paramaecium TaxID=2898 RepID=A0A7S4PQ98_9CRYP|mmetsp:Transcript_10070/g.28875  ORF Transcript_10070/g.28875 Transcript_10070/m.28875 type:complete len:108 (+) Transcript_10070:443-766(+)
MHLQRSQMFSPRSRRLSILVQKPKNADDAAIAKLQHVRESVADTIEQTRKVLQLTSSFLVAHFESIPSHELSTTIQFVFCGFDKNGDGHLDFEELSEAFACMVLYTV